MKRYFIVMYTYVKRRSRYYGICNFISEHGKYVNRIDFANKAKEQINATSLTITNIIELTESDYNDWNANN